MKKQSLEPVLHWEGGRLYCGTIMLAEIKRDGKNYRMVNILFTSRIAEIAKEASLNDEVHPDVRPVIEEWYRMILREFQFSNE